MSKRMSKNLPRNPALRILLADNELVVDHFAGGGGASSGVAAALGRDPDIAINHDPEAIAMHQANHPGTKHYVSNIWDVDPVKACGGRPVGLMWTSPTCFPAGTLVLTRGGLRPIEGISVGCEVLTHESRWRRVTSTISKKAATVLVRGHGHYGLETTPDHPFYSKRITRRWPRGRKGEERRPGLGRELVENPYWPVAETLEGKLWTTPTSFGESAIPICSTASFSDDFFYFVGRWIGDGYTSKGDVCICTGADDFGAMRTIFRTRPLLDGSGDRVSPRVQATEAPAPKLLWGNARLACWLEENFGSGCENKQLPSWALTMQESWRRALLEGYVDADGHVDDRLVSTTSVSKVLSVGVRLLAASLGHAPCLYFVAGRSGQIEGRSFVGRDSYKVNWRVDNQKETSFRDGTHLFTFVKEVSATGRTETVYCLQVEDDESYVADGIVVHNCTHFSKAKGTALSEESISLRALADVAIKWAEAVQPRIICLENVEEFVKWGPLHPTTFKPIKSREGELFREWVGKLEGAGYVVEWRILRACDYGAPTTRKRLFLVARCDGLPIVWPMPTHAKVATPKHKRFRSAAQCIDWSDLGQSIFERDRPLADKTLARIARGIRKFVLDNPAPFIVPATHGDSGGAPDMRSHSADEPLRTLTTRGAQAHLVTPYLIPTNHGGADRNDLRVHAPEDPVPTICAGKRGQHAVVSPTFIMMNNTNNVPRSTEEPCPTITTGNRNYLVMPYLVHRSNGERPATATTPAQLPRIYDAQEPLGTVMAQGQKHAVCAALLIKHNGGSHASKKGGQEVTRPIDTISCKDSKSLAVAHLVRYNGDRREGEVRGALAQDPLPTQDTSNRFGVVSSRLVKLRGTSEAHLSSSGSSMEDPVPTVSASGTHMAAVSAFLVRYNGQSEVQNASSPMGTLTTKDRYGLVTVVLDGETYILADIRMRMLKPRELFNAQAFPADYVIDPMWNGKPLTKTAQVRMCGNSVPPVMAEVIARAQVAA